MRRVPSLDAVREDHDEARLHDQVLVDVRVLTRHRHHGLFTCKIYIKYNYAIKLWVGKKEASRGLKCKINNF